MELTGIRYLRDLSLAGRKVLCRVDFNVPLGGEGAARYVRDDARIQAALPTINHIREAGAHLVLASHLGRPKGPDPELSLEPCAKRLAELVDVEVRLTDDCVGEGVERVVRDLPAGGIALLENLRFHAAEKTGDPHFARALAAPFDVYVNDAFGTCHRAHASMYGVARHLRECAAGTLIEREVRHLGDLLQQPATPFVALLGGAKVSDKIDVIRALLGRCDTILIGGAMALTMLRAQGISVGNSRVESDRLDLAMELMELARARRSEIILPSDHLVADHIDATTAQTTAGAEIDDGLAAFDIGPQTLTRFAGVLAQAGTVFWNGPMGVFENNTFNQGTFGVAKALAESNAVSVVGGGDSAAAVREAGLLDQISHVSTGGGASLQFIEGNPLPGLEALRAGHEFPPSE